jgi:hypothetical protein
MRELHYLMMLCPEWSMAERIRQFEGCKVARPSTPEMTEDFDDERITGDGFL